MSRVLLLVTASLLLLMGCIPSHQRAGLSTAITDRGTVVTGTDLSFGYSELRENDRNGLFGIDGTSGFIGMHLNGAYETRRGFVGNLCPLAFGFYGLPGGMARYHGRASVPCVGVSRDEEGRAKVHLAFEIQAGPSVRLFETDSTDHTLDFGFFVRRQQTLESSRDSAWLFGVSAYWSGTSDSLIDGKEPRE